ncbi:MAG: hypothetical protein GC203_15445 [Phenylobacterium sp.]|uniref:M56 family metallopeptidase n=1 Tax=Phenylobacterium sp. TaxID=1871053 RepID=UPI0025F318C9|nr:M56 family metallopeptidase [Phenylobacterium sp.]MBI1199254.1 hypothetical protein [Phenylobacterium sp.]
MADLGETLLRVNLAAGAAVVLVLLLRGGVRRLFGARAAYGLWLLVPAAAAAMLAPPRTVIVRAQAPVAEWLSLGGGDPAQAAGAPFDHAPWLLGVWLAGVAASAMLLAWRQLQFARQARRGRAGPAAVGVLRQRIVLPADFQARYAPIERRLILAHERNHIAVQDPRINALVAVARCLAWFNPAAHVLARALRLDQELACDAAVVAAHPTARRAYAEAMLKTQAFGAPPPLGCHWSAAAAHPLAQRIEALGDALPGPGRRAAGLAAVAGLALAFSTAAWTARPPQVVTLEPRLPALAAAPPQADAPATRRDPEPHDPEPRPGQPAKIVRTAEAAPPATTPSPAAPPAPPPAPAAASASGRLVRGVAQRSHVEPGSAVRVYAAMTDPDGRRLVTDLTAYGSQNRFRTGAIERDGSRYSLFTAVEQHGDMLRVTASLGRAFRPGATGSIDLRSGETGTIRLPNGLAIAVTPTLRDERPDELARAREEQAREAIREVERAAALGRWDVRPTLPGNEPL